MSIGKIALLFALGLALAIILGSLGAWVRDKIRRRKEREREDDHWINL